MLAGLLNQFHDFDARVTAYDRQIRALAEASEPARRLMRVEAIGPQTATPLVASIGDQTCLKSGRSFAASESRFSMRQSLATHGQAALRRPA